jgi:hypothetical protein
MKTIVSCRMKIWTSILFIYFITLLILCGGAFELRNILVSIPVYTARPTAQSVFVKTEPRMSRFFTEQGIIFEDLLRFKTPSQCSRFSFG